MRHSAEAKSATNRALSEKDAELQAARQAMSDAETKFAEEAKKRDHWRSVVDGWRRLDGLASKKRR